MPEAQAVANEQPDVELVTVMIAGNPQRAEAITRKLRITAPVLLDRGHIRAKYGVDRTPITFILRPDGTAAKMLVGAQSKARLDEAVAAVL